MAITSDLLTIIWRIMTINLWPSSVTLPGFLKTRQPAPVSCRSDSGHLPDQSWKRRPGRPNNRWIDQLRMGNNNTPPADLWRRSTTRGHSEVTLRSSMTARWRRRRIKIFLLWTCWHSDLGLYSSSAHALFVLMLSKWLWTNCVRLPLESVSPNLTFNSFTAWL